MKYRFLMTICLFLFASLRAEAANPIGWWDLNVSRIEIAGSGVFLVTPLVGLTAPNCISTTTYNYVLFSSADQKLADRALTSTYYAKLTSSHLKALIVSCAGAYAVADSIWVE